MTKNKKSDLSVKSCLSKHLLKYHFGSKMKWVIIYHRHKQYWNFGVNVNTQSQCWLVIIATITNFNVLIFFNVLRFVNDYWIFIIGINSFDHNDNVNSCIQSLTILIVNVNYSKIVNLMSLVNVNTSKSQCQWYPQLHCSFLICHLLLKLVSTPLGPDPQGGDGPKTKAAQFYALQPNTKSASNLIFTTLIWLTPLQSG